MAKINNTIPVTGIISPTDDRDTYPVTTEEYNRGGYRAVKTYDDMLNIPEERRKEGMKVFCIDTQIEYVLLNNNFQEVSSGNGGGSTNVAIGNGLIKQKGVISIDTDVVGTVEQIKTKQDILTLSDNLKFKTNNVLDVDTGKIATKEYTEFQFNKRANLETDNTFTNTLNDFTNSSILVKTPTQDNEVVNKKYVDDKTNAETGNFTNLSINSGTISTVDENENTSIVNKAYVDNKLSSINVENVAKVNEANIFTKTNTVRRLTIDDSQESIASKEDGSITKVDYEFGNKDAIHKEYVDNKVSNVENTVNQIKVDYKNDLNNVVFKNDIFTKQELQDKLDEKPTLKDIEELYVSKANFTTELNNKVNANQIYSKDEINNKITTSLVNYYDKQTIDDKLLTKVDTVNLEASYTNNTELTKLLTNKVNQEELKKAVQNRLKDFQDLTQTISDTEDKINQNFQTMSNEVNNVKTEVYIKLQDLQSAMVDTSDEFTNKLTTIQEDMLTSKTELTTKLTETNESLSNASKEMNTKLNDVTTNLTSVKEEVVNKINTNTTEINSIKTYIPNTTTAENTLVDKAYVIDLVTQNKLRILTADANGNAFATKAALLAGPYFNNGVEVTPALNDFAIVREDEDHDNNQCRYNYDGNSFYFFIEYKNTIFTTEQQSAIDSGITTKLVNQITTNTTSIAQEVTNRENDRDSLKVLIAKESTDRSEAINQVLLKVSDEITARENDRDSLKVQIATESTNRTAAVNKVTSQVSSEAATREQGDLEIKNDLQEYKVQSLATVNEIKKSISDNKIALETTIGDIESLETTNKNSIVEGVNSLKEEINNSYLPITGGTLTGSLSVTLPGSGTVFGLYTADKGIEMSLDAATGYLNIIPKSRPDLGFSFTANTFAARFTELPSNLGYSNRPWSNVYATNLNDIPVNTIAIQDDNADISDSTKVLSSKKVNELVTQSQKSCVVTQNEYNNLVKTNALRTDVVYLITSEVNETSKPDAIYKEFLNLAYPIGSVYISVVDTFDPNNAFGGTWVKVEEGVYLKSTTITPDIINSTGYATSVTNNFKSLDVIIWKRTK